MTDRHHTNKWMKGYNTLHDELQKTRYTHTPDVIEYRPTPTREPEIVIHRTPTEIREFISSQVQRLDNIYKPAEQY